MNSVIAGKRRNKFLLWPNMVVTCYGCFHNFISTFKLRCLILKTIFMHTIFFHIDSFMHVLCSAIVSIGRFKQWFDCCVLCVCLGAVAATVNWCMKVQKVLASKLSELSGSSIWFVDHERFRNNRIEELNENRENWDIVCVYGWVDWFGYRLATVWLIDIRFSSFHWIRAIQIIIIENWAVNLLFSQLDWWLAVSHTHILLNWGPSHAPDSHITAYIYYSFLAYSDHQIWCSFGFS